MNYFVFELEYSQTDKSNVIVRAESRIQAERWLKRHGEHGPRYVNFVAEIENIISLEPGE